MAIKFFTAGVLRAGENGDHFIEVRLHRLAGAAHVTRFDRRRDRPVFQFGTVRHVVRRIVTLQHAEHAAVTVAEQVADDERIGRVAAGTGDADVEQPIAGVGGGTGAVIAAVLLVGSADARQLFVGGVARGQCGGLRFDQQTGLQQRNGGSSALKSSSMFSSSSISAHWLRPARPSPAPATAPAAFASARSPRCRP